MAHYIGLMCQIQGKGSDIYMGYREGLSAQD